MDEHARPTTLTEAIRSKNLFGVAVLYLGAAFFVLEAVGIAIETYGLPASLQGVAGIVALLGLPTTLAAAWFAGRSERTGSDSALAGTAPPARAAWVPYTVMALLFFAGGIGLGVAVRPSSPGALDAGREAARGPAAPTTLAELRNGISGLGDAMEAVATDSAALELGRSLRDEGLALISAGDLDGARGAFGELRDVHAHVRQEYRVVIDGGVWRHPPNDPDTRIYYLRVRAFDRLGKEVPFLIRSRETGRYEMVTGWGERVSREVYEAVERDKTDNGVIDDDLFSTKLRGFLDPERRYPDLGQLTKW